MVVLSACPALDGMLDVAFLVRISVRAVHRMDQVNVIRVNAALVGSWKTPLDWDPFVSATKHLTEQVSPGPSKNGVQKCPAASCNV